MEIQCPKCKSKNISRVASNGGHAIYNNLKCKDCNFEGGLVRVYSGEGERVAREIKERFSINNTQDDCKAFIGGLLGN